MAVVQKATCLTAASSLTKAIIATPTSGRRISSVSRWGSGVVLRMTSCMRRASLQQHQEIHAQYRDGPQGHRQGIVLDFAALEQPEAPPPQHGGTPNAVHHSVYDGHVHHLPEPVGKGHRRLDDRPVIELVHIPLVQRECVDIPTLLSVLLVQPGIFYIGVVRVRYATV